MTSNRPQTPAQSTDETFTLTCLNCGTVTPDDGPWNVTVAYCTICTHSGAHNGGQVTALSQADATEYAGRISTDQFYAAVRSGLIVVHGPHAASIHRAAQAATPEATPVIYVPVTALRPSDIILTAMTTAEIQSVNPGAPAAALTDGVNLDDWDGRSEVVSSTERTMPGVTGVLTSVTGRMLSDDWNGSTWTRAYTQSAFVLIVRRDAR
jgi:hypothetical protein